MSAPLTVDDRQDLHDLVSRYALSVDTHDFDGLRRVFVPDAELDTGRSVRKGIEEILSAMEGLRRYTATTHLIGQQLIEGGPDDATGVVYCTAHHLFGDEGSQTDMVMHIRYHDHYGRTSNGWRITQRRLDLLWRDETPVT